MLFPSKPEPSQSKIIITSNNTKSKLSNVSGQDVVVITKLQTTPKSQEEETPLETQLPQPKPSEEKKVKDLVRIKKKFFFFYSKRLIKGKT